jgi:hypothetical protein
VFKTILHNWEKGVEDEVNKAEKNSKQQQLQLLLIIVLYSSSLMSIV